MNDSAIIVFGKNPTPGKVKTRLASEFGLDGAAELYGALLIDTLVRFSQLGAAVRLYLAPTTEPISATVAPFDGKRLRQRGNGLGPRMKHAFEDTFDEGYHLVVIIGSDHPTLPLSTIEQAFTELRRPDTVVIGPSHDGGYYLLGLSEATGVLFDGMTYSHPDVFVQSGARARSAGLKIVTLEPWYDIDTPHDVRRLAADLIGDETPCPHTREWLLEAGLMQNASVAEGSASEKLYFEPPPQMHERSNE
ncbi:MAG TPA: TIGR04282 family arsenosugar biosynthesis glycosyltransferase [Rhodothermales bacterium]|nr:TIGR04282 family arsenosugar biosynthesis glycosyltransferase [Rhodothermales bacterium]